jgi:hypothetical protein
MSWPAASSRRARIAVSYVHDGTKPIRVKVGPEATDWWAAAQANGYDLLCCDASGATLAHQRLEWTAGGKADIKIALPASSAGVTRVVYLYVGAASTVNSDPSTTVTGDPTVTGQAGLDTAIPVVVLDAVAPVKTSTGAEPGARVGAIVGEKLAVLLPVLVALAERPVQGGRELEDVEGVTVAVAAGTGENAPATPAGWALSTDVRLIASLTRGVGVLALLGPDEAASAVLRITVYLRGPASGSLPSRQVVYTAIVAALAPLEV